MPPTTAYLILGSNADPENHLAHAVRRLRDFCDVLAVSFVDSTNAEAETAAGADKLNAAVKVSTTLAPEEYKVHVLHQSEGELSRQREGERSIDPIDLDIVLWGDTLLDFGANPWHSPAS